ncbi:type II secretion system protein N [Maricaulis sp.]|uniref:type II secretion system protein N n=1 Tax=Maricaulis sp. TaxID=1486257 RepID=UPI002602E8C2|nr:type II secretion system protein N [Maricaulis sp.]
MLRYLLIGLAAVLVWLIALMPLKAVMIVAGGASAFGYQDVYGSLWHGRVYGMRIAAMPVREIELAVNPLPLLVGRLSAAWSVSDSSVRGQGQMAMAGDWMELRETRFNASLERLGVPVFPGLDLDGQVSGNISRLELDGDTCRSAQGTVRTAALTQFAATYGFQGPDLAGQLSCREGRLVLDFSGMSDDLGLTGEIEFDRSGYQWSLELQTSRAELADVLALGGLERDGDVWRRQGSVSYGQP